jgi:transcriptional regulator with XRE-family HTH domain
MPNIASLLKSEISRLARKEIRREVIPLRKATAGYRREIASLKRTLAALDRRTKRVMKQQAPSQTPTDDAPSTRFVAKGLVSLRKRLGLSAADLARLLGVSMQSVYNWERKKATPRREQVAAIAQLRGIGKKEAHQRLDGRVTNRVSKRTQKRSPKKRATRKRVHSAKRTVRRTRTRAK